MKWLAEPFHAFLHNIMRGFVGTTIVRRLISLPRSQVKSRLGLHVAGRDREGSCAVAGGLIANDETEISEVVRRRLFRSLAVSGYGRTLRGPMRTGCFERRAQLPGEWTAIDTATSEHKA
jgi:hypothetical protein